MIVELLVMALLVLGGGFILIAGIGIVRFPDVLARAHALSKALTLGLSLILIVLFTVTGTSAAGVKVFLVVTFQFLTIPIAAHVFALYASER